jgi:serine/threonine-protein kinase
MHKLLRNLFWLIPFLAFAIGYYAISFVFKSKTIQAPALVGKCIDKAVIILSEQNLNIRIVGNKNDSDLPEGTIISQTPLAGSKIKENQTLYVVIAKKPAAILAPDFKQKTISAATRIAQDLGLHIKTYAIPSSAPDQQCIAQFPAAGQELDNNTIIVYSSAANTKSVIMPSCKDMHVSEVISFLQLYGITPTILHTRPELLGINHQCAQCIVIDQRPLAGSLVQINAEKPLSIQLQVQEK